ncbi:MAG: class II aldolase/adducin family protein, partial [Dehalococcoidia bacterium]
LICVVGLDGVPVVPGPRPSSELPLHLAVYRSNGAGSVVHTHPPYATAVSTVLDELPAIHYLAAELGGPVRVAPYALFGTDELAAAASHALDGRHAVLLAAHGAVTVGDTVAHAYARSLHLEWLARLHAIACTMGTPRRLSPTDVEDVATRLDALAYGASRSTSSPLP